MKKNVLKHWYLTLIVAISIVCYLSVFVSPVKFWPAVFGSYAIPGIVLLNLILFFGILFFKKQLVVFPLVALLLGLPFVLISISYRGENTTEKYDLSILSFNARLFQTSNEYNEYSSEMIDWVANDSSQIKCIQEYSPSANNAGSNVDDLIKGSNYNSSIYTATLVKSLKKQGVAIFTTYEILDTGMVWTDNFSINVALYADIKKGKDTLRIYNVHLASMRLNIKQYKYLDQYKSKLKSLISRLKYGSEIRSSQIDKLIAHANECPYPYIICGDFNETPYSYNYFKLKRHFSNAFEKAGNGFGFTFNSLLFFLRIDHHFYSDEMESIDFRVDRSMKLSDHFPTRGYYRLNKK